MQLTIYCALYAEAQEIIHTFQLKKETARTHFQMFSDDTQTLRLVITGVGAIAAASAVAEVSALFPPEETDLLLNFGTCAASPEIPVGEIFLGNKLTEECSGRTFYPDIMYRYPFLEAEVVSCGKVLFREDIDSKQDESARTHTSSTRLYDMEAAAIYQAGSYSYGPHQMLFLKMVSDHGMRHVTSHSCGHVMKSAENFDSAQNTMDVMEQSAGSRHNPADMREQVDVIMEKSALKICAFISFLLDICQDEAMKNGEKSAQRQQVKTDAARLGEELHCSVVMRGELEQLLWYWKLTHVDYDGMIADIRRQGRVPARDKREGKKILDELKGYLF